MTTEGRVKRLREMVEQIERLPVSPDRERLLSEIRSRAVDVDTGVTPQAMRVLREPAPPPVLTRPPKRDRPASIMPTPTPAPPAPAVAVAPSARVTSERVTPREEQPPRLDDVLSLEDSVDSPLPAILGRDGRPVPPWALGLRG
jgi:hypothetical protein